MSQRDFLLPDLGEGLTEAEVLQWLVQVGDVVTVDQPVVEVETAKAAVEVPVPYAGVVAALHGEPGQTVAVGAPLITIAVDAPVALQEPGVVTAGEEASGNVLIGYGTSAGSRRARRRRPAPHAARTTPAAAPEPVPSAPAAASAYRTPVLSPVVRRLAREHGVDVQGLTGSGPGGAVTRRDVEAAVAARTPVPAQPAAAAPPAVDGERRIPVRGAQKVAVDVFSRSRREIPEATVWVDVDATALLETRAALNAARPDEPVSLLGLLARFCVAGLQRHPELNARWDDARREVVVPPHVNLGFAAQTERGLVVPVVKGADRLTTRGLSAALRQLTDKGRAGTLSAAELTGGTFTLNNYGVFGVDGSAAIINHPEVAIVGIGRILDRAWVVDGQLAVRKVAELTISFDHRVCDGGTAGGFLRFLADCVEDPRTVLGEV